LLHSSSIGSGQRRVLERTSESFLVSVLTCHSTEKKA
jgi:hypothetical protein